MAEAKTFMVEDATLVFKNFAGKEDKYNRAGDRNFSALLPTDVATQMESDGWNVKWLRPREEGEEPTAYIQVAVNYKNRPPRIVMITSAGRTPISEEMVETLDYADISLVDLIARGYEWDVNGKKGIKAYLQSMFVTIQEDLLEQKYGLIAEDDEE
jgi:hypothetical protein